MSLPSWSYFRLGKNSPRVRAKRVSVANDPVPSGHGKPPINKELAPLERRVKTERATRTNHSILSARFVRVQARNALKHAQNDLIFPVLKILAPILITFIVEHVRVMLNITRP